MRMLSMSLNLVSMALVLLFLNSCSKAPTSDVSQVRLQLPQDWGHSAQSRKVGTYATTADLTNIIINVTGTGISAPIVYTWSNHQSGATQPPAYIQQIGRAHV